MRILIVNDDGISAPGIRALTIAAVKRGHQVTVYAPDSQRSAASHAISLTMPLRAVPYEHYECAVPAYAVNGTPADCARLGIFLEKENAPIDFVLSGINRGANRGAAALYSGTVGAAMEASLCGYQALAVSLCAMVDSGYEIAAELGVRCMEWAAKHPLPLGEIYSLNVPLVGSMPEVRAATVSTEYIFPPEYTAMEDGSYVFITGKDTYEPARDSDTAITESGYASLSVLSWNLFAAMPNIEDLNTEAK